MMDSSIQTAVRKIVYIMVVEQGLRAGEGMSPKLLAMDLDRHGISGQDQQAALDLALREGWLQKGPLDEIQLTDEGFDMDFSQ